MFTDLPQLTTVEVVSEIADHRGWSIRFSGPPLSLEVLNRDVWHSGQADWSQIRRRLRERSREWLAQLPPDAAAERLTDILLSLMRECVPQSSVSFRPSHPWLAEECVRLVEEKKEARFWRGIFPPRLPPVQ